MELCYNGKKEIVYEDRVCMEKISKHSAQNLLFWSENLKALRWLLENGFEEKIDLIYIDPPFATDNTFWINKERANTISAASKEAYVAYEDRLKGEEFLEFIRQRLLLLKRLLSPQGSIYLHIDYKVGHYIKILMDEIFGIENFRNDITRIKCNPKNFKRKGFGNIKDMILFYTKGENYIWNEPFEPYSQEDIKRLYPKVDKDGRRYTTVPIHAPGETKKGETSKPFKGMLPPPGRHWRTDIETLERWDREGLIEWSCNGVPRKKIFADERRGKRVQDIWEFKDPQKPLYPTQKSLELLERIVQTSSNEDSYVLDCFCGSGTTLVAAEKNNRKWIGVDRAQAAIEITCQRLKSQNYVLYKECKKS